MPIENKVTFYHSYRRLKKKAKKQLNRDGCGWIVERSASAGYKKTHYNTLSHLLKLLKRAKTDRKKPVYLDKKNNRLAKPFFVIELHDSSFCSTKGVNNAD